MKSSPTTRDTIEIPPRRILAIATHERELMLCVLGVVVLLILPFSIDAKDGLSFWPTDARRCFQLALDRFLKERVRELP